MKMMGIQMKMLGESMAKSNNAGTNAGTTEQSKKLILLGEEIFSMGRKMSPQQMVMNMDKDMKMCPMCEKMMSMNEE